MHSFIHSFQTFASSLTVKDVLNSTTTKKYYKAWQLLITSMLIIDEEIDHGIADRGNSNGATGLARDCGYS